MSEDIRWIQRLDNYQNALATLERVVEMSIEHIKRVGQVFYETAKPVAD
jgi:hypothetical protein